MLLLLLSNVACAQTEQEPSNVIGTWIDDRPYAGYTLILSEEGESLVMTRLFTDGSSTKNEMVSQQTTSGIRLGTAQDSEDYYILKPDGSLELRDSMGLIATLQAQ